MKFTTTGSVRERVVFGKNEFNLMKMNDFVSFIQCSFYKNKCKKLITFRIINIFITFTLLVSENNKYCTHLTRYVPFRLAVGVLISYSYRLLILSKKIKGMEYHITRYELK